METIAGKIAEWIIEQTRLYKTRGDVTVELYAGDSTHSPRVRVYGAGKYVEMGNGAFTSTENYNGSTNVAEGTVVVNGRELTLTRSDWEEHATWSDWVRTFLTSLKDSKLTLKHWVWNDETTQYDEIETYVDYNGIHAANEVYAKGRNLLKEFFPMTNYFATQIPANANLNTTTYLQIGSYYATPNATVQTFTNCPTDRAFLMTVQLTNNSDLDITGTTYRYILRTIYAYNGEVWFQYVGSGATAGVFTYNAWVKLRGSLATGNVIKQTETTSGGLYSLLMGESERSTSDETESTRKSYGLTYNPNDGSLRVERYHTGTSNQFSYAILGNDTASGTAGAVAGVLRIYGQKSLYAQIYDKNNALTAHRSIALQDKEGELPVLEDGVFDAGNRNIQITGADTGRSASIRTKAGGIVYLTYFANGNHGVYSSGYETDVTNSSTYTSSNKWIIRRNSAGNVYVDEWGSIGSAGRPVYFNSNGRPVAVTETSGEATLNTTNARGYVNYWKQGKVVTVSLYSVAVRTNTVDTTLFTGLPAPSANFTFGLACETSTTSDWGGVALYVDTSGNIKLKKELLTNSGKMFVGSFTYLSAS